MATKAEVLRLLRFRDQLTTRDVETLLDYVDQEVAVAVGGHDNLGDHTATEPLNMQTFDITNVASLLAPPTVSGTGPAIEIIGSDNAGGSNGDIGGAINITGGTGGTFSTNKGGDVNLIAGPSGVGAVTLAAVATLQGGAADGAGFGGTGRVLGGTAGLTGGGGQARLEAGAGGATSGNGGGALIRGGSATVGNGGNIDLEPGNTPSGTRGVVNLHDGNGATVAQFDEDNTALNTRFLIYDVDRGTLERVSVGVADSGGVGFKLLRVQNT